MAKIETVVLTDDLDGSPAEVTVRFALDGTSFEIDLSEANAARLREDLAVFVAHGRKVRPEQPARRPASAPTARRSAVEVSAIRTWANDSGLEIPARGRIPADAVAAFKAAWQETNPGLSYTDYFA